MIHHGESDVYTLALSISTANVIFWNKLTGQVNFSEKFYSGYGFDEIALG